MFQPYLGEMLEDLRARTTNNSISVPPCERTLLSRRLIKGLCKPNMALIWPAPAPNPIIKPARLNISHWYGPFQLLRDITMWVYCVHSQSHSCLVLRGWIGSPPDSITISRSDIRWNGINADLYKVLVMNRN